jgi:hypothetical protein
VRQRAEEHRRHGEEEELGRQTKAQSSVQNIEKVAKFAFLFNLLNYIEALFLLPSF